MRILFSLYLLLIINIALSQNCELLAKNGMYLLELKQIGSDSIMSVSSIILHSTGAIEYVDKTIKFLTNSTLAFGDLEYPAVECKDDILTIRLNSKFKPDEVYKYKINKVNKIIDDPVNQIDILNSMCNQLSFPGVYDLEVEDDEENIFNATIDIYNTAKVIFYYQSQLINVEYRDAIFYIGKGSKQKIDSCKDYPFESKLRLEKKSFIIKKIVPSQPSDKAIRNEYCQLLSVKGSYVLWNGNHEIGKLDVKENSAYKYVNFLFGNKFFLDYSIYSFPVFTDEKFVEYKIVGCSFDESGYKIKLNVSDDVHYNFTNVTVLHQDSSYLLTIKRKTLAEFEQKYNLTESIKSTEIDDLMHSSLHIIDNKDDFCRKLIMPGTYGITDKNGKTYIFINHHIISIKALNDYNDYAFKTVFRFFAKVVSTNEEDYHVYKCEVYKNESKLYSNIEKYTPLTTTSPESLVQIKILSVDSFLPTTNMNWTNKPKYKIMLRSEKICSELNSYSKYKLHTFDGSSAEVFIKKIVYRDYDFIQGFMVYLVKQDVKDRFDYSNINITDRNNKITSTKELLNCTSNENGSYFYDTNYRGIREHYKYIHHSSKQKSEYKFIKLEKIKSKVR